MRGFWVCSAALPLTRLAFPHSPGALTAGGGHSDTALLYRPALIPAALYSPYFPWAAATCPWLTNFPSFFSASFAPAFFSAAQTPRFSIYSSSPRLRQPDTSRTHQKIGWWHKMSYESHPSSDGREDAATQRGRVIIRDPK
ncbi:hypothetical protein EDB86DRAFT_994442 [Lactarius hatsudake]|nr:hypothetical protein EDB86DRAFT_994442 [Lactarius hatsudake]